MKGDKNAAAQVGDLFHGEAEKKDTKAKHPQIEERKKQERAFHDIKKQMDHDNKMKKEEEKHVEHAAIQFEHDFNHPDSKQTRAHQRHEEHKAHKAERIQNGH